MSFIDFTSITLKMLIDSHILKPGQVIYPMKGKMKVEGVLNEDGTISMTINTKIRHFLSPSGAAKAVENKSVNGWIYWGVKENNALVELSTFRLKFKEGL